jgi:hypothetical protein
MQVTQSLSYSLLRHDPLTSSQNVTFNTLAERHKTVMGVRCKNSRKHCHHVSDPFDEEDVDDSSIIPEDELSLLVNAAIRKEV